MKESTSFRREKNNNLWNDLNDISNFIFHIHIYPVWNCFKNFSLRKPKNKQVVSLIMFIEHEVQTIFSHPYGSL